MRYKLIGDRVFLLCELCHYYCPRDEIIDVRSFNVCNHCASVVQQALMYQLADKIESAIAKSPGFTRGMPKKMYVVNLEKESLKSVSLDCLPVEGVVDA